MATYQRGKYWWYRFRFAGERIDEPTKSTSRTVAKEAERQHRRALEAGYNNFKEVRQNRVRILEEIIDEYLTGYRLRYRSASFAEYALGHVSRLLGTKIVADITEVSVLRYQEDRLREKAAPKSINEEVRFLLKMLGDPGEVIRAHLKKTSSSSWPFTKASAKPTTRRNGESRSQSKEFTQSPHVSSLHAGAQRRAARYRDQDPYLGPDQLRREYGPGRQSQKRSRRRANRSAEPEVYQALIDHRAWYRKRFGEIRDEWYVFPWGKPRPSDPTRHITSFKKAWNTTREKAKVKGRWHDNRHTLITELAESGAGDETIMEIAGHVDRQMLRHYSHIRMKAKREAVESVIDLSKGKLSIGFCLESRLLRVATGGGTGRIDRDLDLGLASRSVRPRLFSHKENSMESFLNEIQVSEKIQVSLACLRRWRLRGEGPQYVKVGPLVRYRPEAIEQWVDALPTGGNGRKPRSVHAQGATGLPRTA